MPKMTPAGLVARSALFTYLSPRMATDSALNYDGLVQGVTSKNYKDKKAAIAKAVQKATDGKLAQDASIADLSNLLDALSPSAESADNEMHTPPNSALPQAAVKKQEGQDDEPTDTVAKIKAYLAEEGVSPDILANLDAFLAEESNPAPDIPQQDLPAKSNGPAKTNGDEDPGLAGATGLGGIDDAMDEDEEERKRNGEAEDAVVPNEQPGITVTKAAMDAAIKKAQTDTIQTQRQVREAERYVRPWVGELAMDAAHPDDVYRAALKALNVTGAEKMHSDALRPVLAAQPRPSVAAARNNGPRLASDAKPEGSFLERFPGAKHISVQ